MNDTATPGWLGDIWLADDHCLLLSTLGRTDRHVHYAHQVLVGLGADVEVRVGEQLCSGPLVLIASQQPHAILSHGIPCLTLFAEPLAFDLADLALACEHAGNSAEHLAESLGHWPRRRLDPRLEKALQRIRALDEQTLPARELASTATLSISQLERLFSGSLKLSVRRLVLWQRLRVALQRALSGTSLTEAALAAGFADSAHFTRSVRRQFGLSPRAALRGLRLRTVG
ncbi:MULTISPECIES: helix-turn-helix domain-containing protein [unclassified Pseudomonas]|uniref:helix-turn-helix domain-containing protein n=1 Tax=unclassified Pseudomonas TaxID=196821 RepID=UPI0009D8C32B|nr:MULTISPECIES: AraC family transcriptional regulator [Pseudomonas]SMC95329.1 Transcriptional regulator containing an amidase domain and an AraC-type DNA-binding HTH domain [Pseudomonas sp. URIL14HWK12:I5]SNS81160.1 Transcriptional regulator containing an amidase domain and an AraC-type DNA-binding HTH domain [Pseudomonas sp. LAMO17WK12:I8]SNY17244.1 Transcriptional regulator containing an amidase domain and an AraC-type DNA-binding HTH domain [Pseudomonas sp. LAMO17WK12:I11]SNY17276.1 Transcr